MQGPLVSVIIPTYNRPLLLERAINSVLDQTYKNIEIIVVDDNSDTNVKEIIPLKPGIKFIKNDLNRGGNYSRNRGLETASGEYINFLDDDDELFPKKIEKQVDYFLTQNDNKLGLVTCHTSDGRFGEHIIKYNKLKGNIYKQVLKGHVLNGIETMLLKKSRIDEIGFFDEKLVSNQEYDLIIRFCEKNEVGYVDEVLTRENKSVNQISHNFDKKIKGLKHLYKKHNRRFLKEGIMFWLMMRIKFFLLIIKFNIGKLFGEKFYQTLKFL